VDSDEPKRRRREPRVRDNPMARIAHEVMVEAERAFRRADALAGGMEAHLLKRISDSTIYAYTNDRPDRNVPPGDVLLAAALAAGISLDEKLGVLREGRGGGVRAQIAEMREELASLRAEVSVLRGSPADDAAAARAERAARRREQVRRSGSAAPAGQSPPAPRRAGRGMAP